MPHKVRHNSALDVMRGLSQGHEIHLLLFFCFFINLVSVGGAEQVMFPLVREPQLCASLFDLDSKIVASVVFSNQTLMWL